MTFDFALHSQPRVALDDSLSEIEHAELVRRLDDLDTAYLFKHALVQDTAYGSLLKHERKRLHRVVGQKLENSYPDRLDEYAPRLALHFAAAGDDEKTFEYATRAGDAAARLYAAPEARSNYALALDTLARLPDDEMHRRARVDTVLKYISVAIRAEGPAETLKRLDQIIEPARDLALRTEASSADRVRLARVQYWQGHAYMHQNNARAAMQAMREVMVVGREVGDPQLLAFPARVIGITLTAQGRFGQAEPILAEAISALELTNDENDWILAVGMHGVAMAARGEYERGVTEAERALTRAMESNTLTGMALGHRLLGLTYFFGGAFDLALAHTRAVIDIAQRSGDRLLAYIGHGFHAWSQLYLGMCAEADASLARSAEIAETIGGRLVYSDWMIAIRAEHAFACGHLEQGITLAKETLNAASRTDGIFSAALAQRVWAKALAVQGSGPAQESETHFAESLRLFQLGDARLEAARTRVAWGKLLRERGDMNAASRQFEQAAAQFEATGLTLELEESRARLHAAS